MAEAEEQYVVEVEEAVVVEEVVVATVDVGVVLEVAGVLLADDLNRGPTHLEVGRVVRAPAASEDGRNLDLAPNLEHVRALVSNSAHSLGLNQHQGHGLGCVV